MPRTVLGEQPLASVGVFYDDSGYGAAFRSCQNVLFHIPSRVNDRGFPSCVKSEDRRGDVSAQGRGDAFGPIDGDTETAHVTILLRVRGGAYTATGNAVSARLTIVGCHSKRSVASRRPGRRRRIVLIAICVSRRASGAPRQK